MPIPIPILCTILEVSSTFTCFCLCKQSTVVHYLNALGKWVPHEIIGKNIDNHLNYCHFASCSKWRNVISGQNSYNEKDLWESKTDIKKKANAKIVSTL